MTLLLSVLIDCQKYYAALSLVLCQHLLTQQPPPPKFFCFSSFQK